MTEHKASDSTRYFEGIDKTEFWWKSPESRIAGDKPSEYRTFEVEELIENPSQGVSDQHFGCRYVHSEYAIEGKYVSHFDGAIRTYEGEAYLERIDRAINRAGKRSDYTKLFRFDGKLAVDDWKALCTDFFRGNDLVPEYFAGRVPSRLVNSCSEPGSSQPDMGAGSAPGLGVLVSFGEPPEDDCIFVVAEEEVTHEGKKLSCIERPEPAALRDFLHGLVDLRHAHMIEHPDRVVNFPRIILGRRQTLRADWQRVMQGLVTAIRADGCAGSVTALSIAIGWQTGEVLTTLSIAGDTTRVANLLEKVETMVNPDADAPEWIDNLKALVKVHSQGGDVAFDPTGIVSLEGILRLDHAPVDGKPPKLYLPVGAPQ